MSSIGSINFIQMSGQQIPSLASAVEIIDRPGVDGTGHRKNAKKVRETVVYTIEGVDSLSSANDAADRYGELKGTKVTVIDDLERVVDNVVVVDVWVTGAQKMISCSDPDIAYIVKGGWLLKPTE